MTKIYFKESLFDKALFFVFGKRLQGLDFDYAKPFYEVAPLCEQLYVQFEKKKD